MPPGHQRIASECTIAGYRDDMAAGPRCWHRKGFGAVTRPTPYEGGRAATIDWAIMACPRSVGCGKQLLSAVNNPDPPGYVRGWFARTWLGSTAVSR